MFANSSSVIVGGAFAVGLCIVPETLPPVVIGRAAKKENQVDNDTKKAILGDVSVRKEIGFITLMTLRIMITEPVVTFLGIYNGFGYGLLFLYLDGVFDVFVVNNGLSHVLFDLCF